jgi:novobiocin biosynthesis protein NovU/D-mycarose 3-C-methyltransferase
MYHPIRSCRACGSSDLFRVFDLGIQPLANDFRLPGEERAGYAPLEVLHCRKCTLAQLSVVVRPEILYKDYPYVTSKSGTMKAHFQALSELFLLEAPQARSVLEIGSNDGDFLKHLKGGGFSRVGGIDPAKNLTDAASESGIPTICGILDSVSANIAVNHGGPYDIVVARHVFCHVESWKEFMANLDLVTHGDSMVFIEVPYLLDMLEKLEFDTIYHEHTSYLSIRAAIALLNDTPFRLHRVVRFPIHGGAIGLIIRKRVPLALDSSITEMLANEGDMEQRWEDFRSGSQRLMRGLKAAVAGFDGVICGFGASAKSTVWLNACGFTKDDIRFMCDCTPQKIGRLSPGTDIEVSGEDRISEANGAVLFAWNYRSEILHRFEWWRKNGGQFIIPVPSTEIV